MILLKEFAPSHCFFLISFSLAFFTSENYGSRQYCCKMISEDISLGGSLVGLQLALSC